MLFRTDDRGVRDSERKAALMHFDSDQVSRQKRDLTITANNYVTACGTP